MKPKMEGAAWDLTPDTYQMVHEPGSERSEHWQPEHMHPEFWPNVKVMGWDYTGAARVVSADDQLPAGSPPEARLDDMRKTDPIEVNYDRLPNYPPQQVVDHANFQLPVEKPPTRHRS